MCQVLWGGIALLIWFPPNFLTSLKYNLSPPTLQGHVRPVKPSSCQDAEPFQRPKGVLMLLCNPLCNPLVPRQPVICCRWFYLHNFLAYSGLASSISLTYFESRLCCLVYLSFTPILPLTCILMNGCATVCFALYLLIDIWVISILGWLQSELLWTLVFVWLLKSQYPREVYGSLMPLVVVVDEEILREVKQITFLKVQC